MRRKMRRRVHKAIFRRLRRSRRLNRVRRGGIQL